MQLRLDRVIFYGRKKEEVSSINPLGDEIIERDDQLILIGIKENLLALLKELS